MTKKTTLWVAGAAVAANAVNASMMRLIMVSPFPLPLVDR